MRWNKRKLKFYRRKINSILSLSILIMVFTVGYALITTSVNITGTGYIDRAEWNVHFANIQTKTGSVTPSTAPTISSNTSVAFAATLANPGDFYEFTIDVVNSGTIPAMIDSFSITPTLTTEQANYFKYSVTYSDDIALANKHLLDSGDTETLKISFEYKTLENAALYPFTDQSFQCGLTINYVQADSTAVVKPIPTFTGIKYGVYLDDNKLTLNSQVPANANLHLNVADALAEWNNYLDARYEAIPKFYIKHLIDDNILSEVSVGFIITPEMVQFILDVYPEIEELSDGTGKLTAGTYELIGGVNEENLSNKPIYEANKATLLTALSDYLCSENSTSIHCEDPNYHYITVNMNGNVIVNNFSSSCNVINGQSFCYD